MDLNAIGAMPHASLPPAVRRVEIANREAADAVAGLHAAALAPAPPRRVELSFHEDLRVLMTRVIDAQTGDLVREYPVRQVLDMVADVMTRMRAREEG